MSKNDLTTQESMASKQNIDSYDGLSDKMEYWIAPEIRNKTAVKIILAMATVMMGIAVLMSYS